MSTDIESDGRRKEQGNVNHQQSEAATEIANGSVDCVQSLLQRKCETSSTGVDRVLDALLRRPGLGRVSDRRRRASAGTSLSTHNCSPAQLPAVVR